MFSASASLRCLVSHWRALLTLLALPGVLAILTLLFRVTVLALLAFIVHLASIAIHPLLALFHRLARLAIIALPAILDPLTFFASCASRHAPTSRPHTPDTIHWTAC